MHFSTICCIIAASISVCFSYPTATTTPPPSQPDIGCYAARERTRRIALFFFHINVPSCVAGGLWRHYQCQLGVPCFCVYVDTGNHFPVLPTPTNYFGYYFRYPTFASHACPIRRERQSSGPSCRNPPLNYPCNSGETRYTYNSNTQRCEETTSCYGYTNRTECTARCTVRVYDSCSLPLNVGRTCASAAASQRYRHDPASGQCQPFNYLGCGGNSNNYASVWDCQRSCVPQVNISVLVRFDRTTYNVTVPQWVVLRYQLNATETNEVTQTTFQSIGRYASSFEVIFDDDHDDSRSLEIVNAVDGTPEEETLREIFPRRIVCAQPPKTDPCRGYMPRWYYDPNRDQCVKFVYGGCRPNGNNFQTADDCTRFCRAGVTPSPLELVQPPTDPNGNFIPNPRGRTHHCAMNGRGELLCVIPGTTAETTTARNDDDENDDE